MDTYKKKIIFKLSLTNKFGLGHFFRCYRLSKTFKNNPKIFFIVDHLPKQISSDRLFNKLNFIEFYRYEKFKSQLIDYKKFENYIKKKDIDLLFIDDYRLDHIWQKKIKKNVKKIVIIDDLADRKFYCDIYINYKHKLENKKKIIEKLNKKNTKLLLGSKYSIIDSNLSIKRSYNKKKNIIISFGNSFNFKNLKIFINRIKYLKHNIYVSIGILSKNYQYIIKMSKKFPNIRPIHLNLNMDKIISKMDLYIGSAGNALYENSHIKLPSIFFKISKNQSNEQETLDELGHYFFLEKKYINKSETIKLIELILKNYSILKKNALNINIINKKGPSLIRKEIKF